MNLVIKKDRRSKDKRDKDKKVHNIWTLAGVVLSKLQANVFVPIFFPKWEDWIFVGLESKLPSPTNFLPLLHSRPNTHYSFSFLFSLPHFLSTLLSPQTNTPLKNWIRVLPMIKCVSLRKKMKTYQLWGLCENLGSDPTISLDCFLSPIMQIIDHPFLTFDC